MTNPSSTQRLDHHGLALEYRVDPCARPLTPPVLILGGMLNTLEMSGQLATRVSTYASAVRAAIPGVHMPGVLPAHVDFDFLTDAVRQVLDTLGHKRVNIQGISYGGNLAHHFASRYPEAVERLMLTGTAGPGGVTLSDPALWHDLAVLWRRSPREVFAQEMTELLTGVAPGLPDAALAPTRRMIRIWAGRLTEDILRLGVDCGLRMQSLTSAPVAVPILAVTGEHDAWARPEACRHLVEEWPDARFTTVRQSDHFLPMTRPAEYAELTRRFFLDEPVDELPYCTRWELFGHAATGRTLV